MPAALAQLSAAEDFFLALDLPFDQRVLDVHRLHLLHRFRRYLAAAGVTERDGTAAWRDCLARAHADFAGAAPPPRGFAVFDKARGGAFVPLATLARPRPR